MSMNALAIEAEEKTSRDDTLAALTKYIPTESVTLYIAVVSAQAAILTVAPWLTASIAYWAFVALTPGLMLALRLRQLALAGKAWRVGPKAWPWWQMIASTIAFAVWALAVPGNPVVESSSAAGGVVAALAALLVSTILNLFSPFFEKRTSEQADPAVSR